MNTPDDQLTATQLREKYKVARNEVDEINGGTGDEGAENGILGIAIEDNYYTLDMKVNAHPLMEGDDDKGGGGGGGNQ